MNTTVRCFVTRDVNEITNRRGVWLMTRPTGYRGAFYHGGRLELQAPRHTIEELSEWAAGSPDEWDLGVDKIMPEEALAEMDKGWPEAKEHMNEVFARHPCTNS